MFFKRDAPNFEAYVIIYKDFIKIKNKKVRQLINLRCLG